MRITLFVFNKSSVIFSINILPAIRTNRFPILNELDISVILAHKLSQIVVTRDANIPEV